MIFLTIVTTAGNTLTTQNEPPAPVEAMEMEGDASGYDGTGENGDDYSGDSYEDSEYGGD